MNRSLLATLLVAAACLAAVADDSPTPDQVLSIWPGPPPKWNRPEQSEQDTTDAEGRLVGEKRVIRLGYVSKPQIHVYQPRKGPGQTAVLVCPGGGYSILAWDLEGTEIAQWLQGLGVTALVVKYRVPTRSDKTKWLAPVQDIQRSVSLVRGGGIKGISPERVGVLGFSAGGNASARVALATDRHYQPRDQYDQSSPHPDFAVLVYPAWLIDQDDPMKLIDELKVTEQSPPMFFAHAFDDRINCMSSVTLFSHLKRNGVSASLHVFSSGGHGFGGRVTDQPTDAWRDLCAAWMRNQGW